MNGMICCDWIKSLDYYVGLYSMKWFESFVKHILVPLLKLNILNKKKHFLRYRVNQFHASFFPFTIDIIWDTLKMNMWIHPIWLIRSLKRNYTRSNDILTVSASRHFQLHVRIIHIKALKILQSRHTAFDRWRYRFHGLNTIIY